MAVSSRERQAVFKAKLKANGITHRLDVTIKREANDRLIRLARLYEMSKGEYLEYALGELEKYVLGGAMEPPRASKAHLPYVGKWVGTGRRGGRRWQSLRQEPVTESAD